MIAAGFAWMTALLFSRNARIALRRSATGCARNCCCQALERAVARHDW